MTTDERITAWVMSGKVRKAVFEFSNKHEWIPSGILAIIVLFGALTVGSIAGQVSRGNRGEMIPVCTLSDRPENVVYQLNGKSISNIIPPCDGDFFDRK